MQLADKMALVQSLADKVSPSAVKHITLCFSTHTHEQIDLESAILRHFYKGYLKHPNAG